MRPVGDPPTTEEDRERDTYTVADAWPRREECPVCLDVVALKKDGTFRRHGRRYTYRGSFWCTGSGATPAVHVHRCRCGATWDEGVNDA